MKRKPKQKEPKVPDYWDFTDIDTPQEKRRELHVGDIYENAATCLECNTYVRSRNRHDYVSCPCGNVAVDGGSWYCKRSFRNYDKIQDHIRPYNDVKREEEE